jgi:hypothetical protein
LFNPDDHAFAVDRGGCEPDGFGNPQAGRVTDGQDHTLLRVVYGTQEACHFVLAQHDWKFFRLTAGGDVVRDDPWPFEGDGVEEPERGDRDNDRTGRETSFPRQMDQIGSDLSGAEKIRRFAKMAGEVNDLRNIHTLRVRSQIANLHVFDHATATRAHGQLLREMSSATWRQYIVSRLSCQTRRTRRAVATDEPCQMGKP